MTSVLSGEGLPKTCWKRLKVEWLFFFLCCLLSGVIGGLVAGVLTGPASAQSAETDTTQVAEGGVSLNEVDDRMVLLHNNISRYFSNKINVLSKTVNQISMTHNVQQSRQESTYQLFSVNDTNIQIGFMVVLAMGVVMLCACCGVCGLGHHVRREGYWPRVRELLRGDSDGHSEGGGVPGMAGGDVGTEASSSPSTLMSPPPPFASSASPTSTTSPASSRVPELVEQGFREMPQWQLDDNRSRLFSGRAAGSPEWSGGSAYGGPSSAASFSSSSPISSDSPASLWSSTSGSAPARGWQPAAGGRLGGRGIARLTTTIDINDGSRVDTFIRAPRTSPEEEDAFVFNSPI